MRGVSWRVWIASAALLVAVACKGGDEPTTPSAKPDKSEKRLDYEDENSVGMEDKRVGRWRWRGDRKRCYYVVDNDCFTSEKAACKAAGCSLKRCEVEETAPARVSCARR